MHCNEVAASCLVKIAHLRLSPGATLTAHAVAIERGGTAAVRLDAFLETWRGERHAAGIQRRL
jgi:hypothetical protein